ncbi:MAG: hypothetical protein ACXW3C_05390 [Pyrinomonadaceae bacterium]
MNVVEMKGAQQAFDIFGSRLLLPRGRVDFRNRDPFAQNTFLISIDVIVGGLNVSPVCKHVHIVEIVSNCLDLRVSIRSLTVREGSARNTQVSDRESSPP